MAVVHLRMNLASPALLRLRKCGTAAPGETVAPSS